MKLFFAKFFAISFLLSLGLTARADVEYGNDRCCEQRSYECSCNPLYCGAHDIQIHAGVMPISWRKRDGFIVVNCMNPDNILNPVSEFPRFKDLFKTPWVIGGQLGRAMSDNTRLYVEFNFARAKAKRDVRIALAGVTPGLNLTPEVSRYRLFNFYVGARYYTNRWCDYASFFLGGKLGAVWHKSSHLRSLLVGCQQTFPCPTQTLCFPTQDLFCRSTSFSGGLNLGVDFCFCGGWSLVITGEVVANCGPCINRNITLNPVESFNLGFATNLLLGHIETELLFPVTIGVRYTF